MWKKWRRRRQLNKVQPGDGSRLRPFRFYQVFTRSLFYISLQDSEPGAVPDMEPVAGPEIESDSRSAEAAADDTRSGWGRAAGRAAHVYAVDVRYWADWISDSDSVDEVAEESDDSWGLGLDWVFGTGSGDESGSVDDSDFSDDSGLSDDSGFSDDSDFKTTANGEGATPPAALYRDGAQVYRSNVPATFEVPGGVIEVATSTFGLRRMHFVPGTPTKSGAETERLLQPDKRSAEGRRAQFGRRFPKLSRIMGWIAVAILLAGLAVWIPQVIETVTHWDAVSGYVDPYVSPINVAPAAEYGLLAAGLVAALERALTIRSHWLIDFESFWWDL